MRTDPQMKVSLKGNEPVVSLESACVVGQIVLLIIKIDMEGRVHFGRKISLIFTI